MRSSSTEPDAAPAAVPDANPAALGPWGRLVLGVLLLSAALIGPAVGLASAQFGDSDTVTISITVPPTSPAPTLSPSP